MVFKEAEQFLYSLSNIPRKEYMRDANGCDEYLPRVQFFLDILGNPEKDIPHYIHVTGTSGKGSVVHFLHSILHTDGRRVASTTSPHPTSIVERWKVGNAIMSKKEFVAIIEALQPNLDTYVRTSPYDMLSYFDMTTVIALYYFAKKKVAWAILEVGCGGMYDATNIIPHKDVAVITNVGLDHTELLGKTTSAIAKRKSGIITGNTNVFTSERVPTIRAIIKKQSEKTHSTCSFTNTTALSDISVTLSGTSFQYKGHTYKIRAIGEHQALNASLAIDIAQSLGIPHTAIARGIATATQPIRMEVVSKLPLMIIDGAHNLDKINSTVRTIQKLRQHTNGRLHIINGFSGDKELVPMITDLTTLSPESVACTRNTVNHFRKVANPSDIQSAWNKLSTETRTDIFLNPVDALTWTKKNMKKHDILLVTGSIFLSSEIKGLLSQWG